MEIQSGPIAGAINKGRAARVFFLAMGSRCLNFDLWLWKTRNGYEASADSPAGGAGPVPFPSPFRGGASQAVPAAREPLKASGRRLFEFVFHGEVRRKWDSCRKMAKGSARILRLRLNPQSPELWEWPWESLYDHGFLALSPEISVARWTLVPKPVSRARRFFNTRVLVVAHPERGAESRIQREINAIEEAFRGRVEVTALLGATPGELQAVLARPVHALHVIGHGTCRLAGDDLAALLKRRAPGLVVLNVGRPGPSCPRDPSAAIAQRLAKEGVPAILAMRFPESAEAAVRFTRALYGSLATGDPVDRAVWRGRHRLAALDPAAEWSSPVLHLAGNRCLPIKLR